MNKKIGVILLDMAGFFSRLFGKKEEEPREVHVVEEPVHLDPFPSNKLVRFRYDDKIWPDKLAIVLSREEATEKQLREMYKKDVPFFYKVAVENDDGRFMQLKLPVSHLRINNVSSSDLQEFKQSHTSIKMMPEPATNITTNELLSLDDIDRWAELIKQKEEME